MPRCYKQDRLGAAVSSVSEEKTWRLVWDGRQPGSETAGAMSQLWDIRQLVRTLTEDIFMICYQETTSDDIKDFMCAAVTMIFRVCKLVKLL
jgi:hypothetical protein